MESIEEVKARLKQITDDRDANIAEFNRLGALREQLQARINACIGAIEFAELTLRTTVPVTRQQRRASTRKK